MMTKIAASIIEVEDVSMRVPESSPSHSVRGDCESCRFWRVSDGVRCVKGWGMFTAACRRWNPVPEVVP